MDDRLHYGHPGVQFHPSPGQFLANGRFLMVRVLWSIEVAVDPNFGKFSRGSTREIVGERGKRLIIHVCS